MITIEMMVSQLEAGVDLEHSATHAWVTTAFPMLTGTLVTVAGFVPIGFAKSGAGEYCYSLFAVIAVALLASWIVAVMFAPVIGVTILPKTMKSHDGGHGEPGRFMRIFQAVLVFCMRGHVGKARHEAREVRLDRRDDRLLKHELRHQRPVRAGSAPPRQVPLRPVVPAEQRA